VKSDKIPLVEYMVDVFNVDELLEYSDWRQVATLREYNQTDRTNSDILNFALEAIYDSEDFKLLLLKVCDKASLAPKKEL
jgi:hypothetical protein